MNHRDISMNSYGITKEKYRELLYFCMQYKDWKKEVNYGLSGMANDGMPHSNSTGDPVQSQAIHNSEYAHKIRMIEDSAIESDRVLAPYIIRAVTDGIAYEYLDVPCGRRQFYTARRKFFYLLSKKR